MIMQIRGSVYVIGTERHESQRIDNQLRGRSGRQGDPGSSLEISSISLDDPLIPNLWRGQNKDTHESISIDGRCSS